MTAIDEVELLVVDRDGLQNMIARNSKIALSIIDRLCRRLQSANLKIQHLVKKDARGLIIVHLRSLFQELPAGRDTLGFEKCLEEVSLGLELPMEDVRRVIGALEQEGLVSLGGDELRILDAVKLAALSESDGSDPPGS